MITENDKKTVDEIKKFIDEHAKVGETGIDWNKIHWIEVLDSMVNCLEKAPLSYRYASTEDVANRFYTAECDKCGWWGSSSLLDGGGQIADTGDHFDCTCPVCGNPDIGEKEEFPCHPTMERVKHIYVDQEVQDIERFCKQAPPTSEA